MTLAKETLGDNITYNEIRLVLKHLAYLKQMISESK